LWGRKQTGTHNKAFSLQAYCISITVWGVVNERINSCLQRIYSLAQGTRNNFLINLSKMPQKKGSVGQDHWGPRMKVKYPMVQEKTIRIEKEHQA
jgi:hypothetical protein